MRLYTLNNTGAVVNPETGETFYTDRDGAIDVPDDLGAHLLATHYDGEKVWEDSGERSIRLRTESEQAQRDPANLLATMNKIADALAGGAPPTVDDLQNAAAAAKAEADKIQKQADEAQAAADAKAAEDEAAAKAQAEADAQAAKEAEDAVAVQAAAEAQASAEAQKQAEDAAAVEAAKAKDELL